MFDENYYMTGKRSEWPTVYNIETTNACNMKCIMCPRTTKMTRPIETMSVELFGKIVDQLKPHPKEKWKEWELFCREKYDIWPNEMSENHFFLYVIPRVIQLHGYGDPLLDPNMGTFVKMLTERGLKSYFSCNPANIKMVKVLRMFEAGLTYIKFSMESVSDDKHKEIRGKASNFTKSYEKIVKLLKAKEVFNLKTTIVITMLDLDKKNQVEEFVKLRDLFKDKDVYIYLKSQDTQWYTGADFKTNSIHWSEPCKHPWMSMTIKSNGEAAMCMEDYNNEIILGDAKTQSLKEIWNGEVYEKFRVAHLDNIKGIRCTDYCEMGVVGC